MSNYRGLKALYQAAKDAKSMRLSFCRKDRVTLQNEVNRRPSLKTLGLDANCKKQEIRTNALSDVKRHEINGVVEDSQIISGKSRPHGRNPIKMFGAHHGN